MDRRERYDPEDIESLLRERSYDELLDEEQAYVLRHLTGREEYEHMRTLLQNLHGADRSRTPIEADPHVRHAVLGVFRLHRTSAWRIWLNTLGGLIPVPSGSVNLRPVIAFGTVLLLVVGGVLVLRYMTGDGGPTQLAEVQHERIPKAAPSGTTDIDTRSTLAKDTVTTDADQEASEATGGPVLVDDVQDDKAQQMDRELAAVPYSDEDQLELAGSTTISREENAKDEHTSSGSQLDVNTQPSTQYATGESRPVSAPELLSNQSRAAATDERAPSAKRAAERSNLEIRGRSLADDAPLIDLLVAGW